MKKVYVGNLNWSMKSEDLKEVFGVVGTVEDAIVITDRQTGRSKGFGFVTFSTEEEAQAAISEFDGKEVEGRELRVSIAEERQERPRTGSRPMAA
ncbi:RNA-binding protein [Candidatus Dojkabacteria bacterium]|uniref:RNA-binding protein n=1 Tax=Candidatus Dojkabacteria bacterium TaxID=2099670 RepID=A0A955RLN7_9BACT|nr:RNA-binding protein [Candidatus Dojkabacteria bacterium]